MYIEHGNKVVIISVAASLGVALLVILLFWIFTQNTEVPDVSGKTAELAKAILEARSLRVYQEDAVYDASVKDGCVVKQDIVPGTRVRKGSVIKIVISKGPEKINMLYLIGIPLPEAKSQLEQAGLKLGRVTTTQSDSVPRDCVVQSFPSANTLVTRGSSIDLIISEGITNVDVPSVVGRGLSRAKDEITKAGFIVGEVKYWSSEDYDPGIVIKQSPEGKTKAAKGSKVDLWVSYEEE